MRRITFYKRAEQSQTQDRDDDDRCMYCGNREFDISATMIQCVYCGVVFGRCNGVWIVDSTTIPSPKKHSTRLTAEAVDSGPSNSAPVDGDGEQVES